MNGPKIPRRKFLQSGLAGGLALLAAPHIAWSKNYLTAKSSQPPLLFIFCANGGASIIDSFLPVRRTPANSQLNAYDDSLIDSIDGSPIRCVKNIDYDIQLPVGSEMPMKSFLQRHYRDMLIVTQQCTSVNHLVAAQRSLNGNHINQGRTLAEAYAAQYGENFLLPNINMAIGGYVESGSDKQLPAMARQEVVADASLFAFSTHGYRNLTHAVDDELIAAARQVRDRLERLDNSDFIFQQSQIVKDFLRLREQMTELEVANLFELLILIDNARHGRETNPILPKNPLLDQILNVFPDLFANPFHAKIALAYLLAHYGLSGAMTIGMSESILFNDDSPPSRILNLPLAFDWSHTDHRGAQNTMWRSLLNGIDGLIRLLQHDAGQRGSRNSALWDRSLIYVATEFGRTRKLERGTGHDLNNGNLLISPLLKGNQLLGGVNPANLMTYGFDPLTGEARPEMTLNEGDIYSLICEALGISFPGRRSFPIAVKA